MNADNTSAAKDNLEAVAEAYAGFGAVGDAIMAVEDAVGGRVVDQAAVFGAHEDMRAEVIIGSGAIDEGGAGLRGGPGVVFRIENQSAGADQRERREMLQRHTEDIGRRDFVVARVDAA